MIDRIAKRLRAWIEKRYGTSEPAVARDGYGSGDLYYGNVTADSLHYEQGPLSIKFQASVHQESGQVDQWDVEITGADNADRDALRDVFHWRHARADLNNHISPRFRFNGLELGFLPFTVELVDSKYSEGPGNVSSTDYRLIASDGRISVEIECSDRSGIKTFEFRGQQYWVQVYDEGERIGYGTFPG